MDKENRSCKGHKPMYVGALPNCATCKRYNKGKCREMIWVAPWVTAEHEDSREMENLMRHDGYRRSDGAVRQIRRG